jgi:hypothetical protein
MHVLYSVERLWHEDVLVITFASGLQFRNARKDAAGVRA